MELGYSRRRMPTIYREALADKEKTKENMTLARAISMVKIREGVVVCDFLFPLVDCDVAFHLCWVKCFEGDEGDYVVHPV